MSGPFPGGGSPWAGLSGGSFQTDTIGALQAGSDVLSGMGQMYADQANASSDRIQAGEWGVQSTSERVMAEGQIAGLKAQYLSDAGGLTARMAASGVDVGQGAGRNARQVMGQNAAFGQQQTMLASDVRADRDNVNVIQANEAARQADAAGGMAMAGGMLKGAMALLPLLSL